VSQTLGINRPEDRYAKPVDNTAIYAFYGCDGARDGDDLVQKQAFEKSKAAFYADINGECKMQQASRQDIQKATDIFWGEQPKELGQQNGAPTTGYSGHLPRQTADGIFGNTFGASMQAAEQSKARIRNEKSETLKQTQQFLPSYADARQERMARGM